MNAFIRKEIRSLAPSFVFSMALTLSFWLLPKDLPNSIPSLLRQISMIGCPAFLLMMCLNLFGREITSGTFASLLVQPVERSRIWWTKILILFIGLALIAVAWGLSMIFAPGIHAPADEDFILKFVILVSITLASGALWTVLLLRHVGNAFWISLLTPIALSMSLVTWFDTGNMSRVGVIEWALVAYSIAGFLFAWRLFLRAQDLQWAGATIQFPQGEIFSRLFGRFSGKRRHRPLQAILLREFQFHQSQWVIAGALALLHLGVIAVQTFGHGFKEHPSVEFVLNQFWMLWLFMPLLIGAAAVADERKMGTLEGELCLPARRLMQFIIKFLVVIGLSLLLGFGMPLLLEGTRILPAFHELWGQSKILPFAAFGFAVICLGAVAFFVSTLSRNTLQAFGPTLLVIFIFAFLMKNGWEPEKLVHYRLWHGFIGYLIGIPLMTATLAALAYWNYKRVLVGETVWRRNLLMFGVAMIVTVGSATAIYHRIWEFATPLEPAHGSARLQTAEIEGSPGWCVIRLPDGRVWVNRYQVKASMLSPSRTFEAALVGGSFLPGSNWVSIAPCWMDLVGIQQNGSLWVSAKPLPSWNSDSTEEKPDFTLKQFGDDHEWKKAVAYGRTALLLKQDGSLWKLGENRSKGTWPGLIHFQPERISDNSIWADIIQLGWTFALQRKDGRIYSSDLIGPTDIDLDHVVVAGDQFLRTTNLEGHHWRDVFYLFPPGSPMCLAGIRDDGGVGILLERKDLGKGRNSYEKKEIQFGTRKDWMAAAGYYRTVVTLAKDGTLWHWIFSEELPYKPRAVQLGTHSDWIAIADAPDGTLSLAADGSLWLWRFEGNRYEIESRSDRFSLLRPSRRPQLMGNIFAETGK